MIDRIRIVLSGVGIVLLSSAATAGELRTTTLAIEGMTCGGCSYTVKTLLTKVPGVAYVAVDMKAHLARVTFDPEQTKPERLASSVTEIGYPTVVKQ